MKSPAILVSFLAISLPLLSNAQVTWVSGVGDDFNAGNRTAPCKTFAGAIAKTPAGGVINVLDPGGFGAVTITKSITIDGDAAEGGVLVSNAARIATSDALPLSYGRTNIVYVDPINGNDANTGAMPVVRTLLGAITNVQANNGGTIIFAPYSSNFVDTAGLTRAIDDYTNTIILLNGSLLFCGGTPKVNFLFQTWSNFFFDGGGGTILSTNLNQFYPFLIPTQVGAVTNYSVTIQNVRTIAESDGIASTGTTTDGKTWPYWRAINDDLISQYDCFSIGTQGTNILIKDCRMRAIAPTITSAFGAGANGHAAAIGSMSPTDNIYFENCAWNVLGFTNDLGIDVQSSAGTVWIKNCNGHVDSSGAATNILSIYNEGTGGAIVVEGYTGDGNIYNASTGTITFTNAETVEWPQTNTTPSSLVGSGGAMIVIAAGPTDAVTLRNLSFEGLHTGASGIQIVSAGTVHIENCRINACASGIEDQNSVSNAALFIKDVTIQGCSTGGISLVPAAPDVATMQNVHITTCGDGLDVGANATAVVVKSTMSGNNNVGLESSGLVRLSLSSITGNGADGLEVIKLGQIVSYHNNIVTGNNPDGKPTSLVTLK